MSKMRGISRGYAQNAPDFDRRLAEKRRRIGGSAVCERPAALPQRRLRLCASDESGLNAVTAAVFIDFFDICGNL